MTTSDIVLLCFAGFVICISFIHLIRLDYWWIRIWDFPHLQLSILASATLITWLGWGKGLGGFYWPILLGLVAALAYQGWLIYPYTPLHRRQVLRVRRRKNTDAASLEANTLRLLVANVYMENTHCPDLCRLVAQHKPDVLLVLEGNGRWQRELRDIEKHYPHRVLHPLENTYGLLFYSKLPLDNPQIEFRVQNDIPSLHTRLQLRSGQWLDFYGIHPMPPSPTEHYRSTERDAELMLVGREARQLTGPVVVAGDLNDVAWSHTTRLFQRISGLLDPRIGRGLFSTFHARYFFLRWPLDHVFVSHHFRLRGLRRLPNCGSDHFPILVSLAYAPDPKRRPEQPQPEGDDLEEAHETIQRAGVVIPPMLLP